MGIENEKYIASVITTKENSWKYIVLSPYKEFINTLNKSLWHVIWILIVFFLIGILFAMAMVNKMFEPISRMITNIEEIDDRNRI